MSFYYSRLPASTITRNAHAAPASPCALHSWWGVALGSISRCPCAVRWRAVLTSCPDRCLQQQQQLHLQQAHAQLAAQQQQHHQAAAVQQVQLQAQRQAAQHSPHARSTNGSLGNGDLGGGGEGGAVLRALEGMRAAAESSRQELGSVVVGQARLLQEQAAGIAALNKQVPAS